MQIGSGTDSPRKRAAKSNGKITKAKKPAAAETLHLKSKHLIATPADMSSMIATAAYYRAAQRGFEPGHELEDWLQAELSVRAQLPS